MVLHVRKAVRALLFDAARPSLSEDLKTILHKQRQDVIRQNAMPTLMFAVTVVVLYFFMSGCDTAIDLYFRVNSCLSCFLVGVCLYLGMMKSFISNWRIRFGFDLLSTITLLHYTFNALLTFDRCHNMISRFISSPIEEYHDSSEGDSEGHGMILSMVGVLLMAYFRINLAPCVVLISISGPVFWSFQVLTLGTVFDTRTTIEVSSSYILLSSILLRFVLRAYKERLDELMRLHSERSEMLHVMKHAAVPVFFASLDETTKKIRIDMWNTALSEMTTQVAEGSLLEDVPCIHPMQVEVLAKSLRQAFSKHTDNADHTQRMLLQMTGRKGHVWLQVDLWFVQQSGLKALVIGSDITDFVDTHHSLLQIIPEESGERPEQKVEPSEAPAFADIDANTLILQKCSAQFDMFFKRRMESKSILEYMSPHDKEGFKQAVASVAATGAPQDLVVGVRASHEQMVSKRGKPALRDTFIPVMMQLSSLDEGEIIGAAPFSTNVITIAVMGLDHESQKAQSDPGCRIGKPSDSGTGSKGSNGGSKGSKGSKRRRASSDRPSRKTRTKGSLSDRVSSSKAFTPQQNDLIGSAFGVKHKHLVAHVIILLKHLAVKYQDAKSILNYTIEDMDTREITTLFGEGCCDWRCASCNAMNSMEETMCFVCGEDDEGNEAVQEEEVNEATECRSANETILEEGSRSASEYDEPEPLRAAAEPARPPPRLIAKI
mmetsp:Transcript_46816/g.102298  ORF Transcript_46816/g.102298 Transcript_46816/m.102298 type:complete len:716 (+) Transcript_46816:61-2208(+)